MSPDAEKELPRGDAGVEARRAYEPDDTDAWGILRSGLVLVAALVLIHLALAGLYVLYRAEAKRSDPAPYPLAEERAELPDPDPRLEVREWQTLEIVRKKAHGRLNGYGWVDRERGVVRIPIEEAIKLAARGRRVDAPATQPAAAREGTR